MLAILVRSSNVSLMPIFDGAIAVRNKLFREAAIQNLAVGERLDTAVQVVSAGTVLVVAAAAAFVVTAMVWSVLGRVPTRIYGEGMLLREGSITDVTSMADGQVQHVLAAVGDVVDENAPLAYIDQPELKKQRSLLENKVSELSDKYRQLASLDEEGRALKRSVFHQQRAAVTFAVAASKRQLTFYQHKLSEDETLLAKGLMTPAAVAETRQKVLDLNDAIYAKQAEGGSIAFNVLESNRTLEERKYDLSMQVSETKRELEEVEKKIDTQSVVFAKVRGRVIELKVTDGDAVTRGRAIATLEAAPGQQTDLVAEIYLPAQDGKRAKQGMPIKLAPSVVKAEEDGFIEGVVESVSPFPVSEQAMLRTVRNPSLVESLLKQGPVYAVHVRVNADSRTPSGLQWSNGHGPNIQIASGTPVHGLITVRTRHPIELVIPALERLVTDAPAEGSVASSAH
jgi:HlyD family secretion protein